MMNMDGIGKTPWHKRLSYHEWNRQDAVAQTLVLSSAMFVFESLTRYLHPFRHISPKILWVVLF
jgi:hypothetical protein